MWHQALPRLHVLITEWFASVFSWFHRWYFIFYLIEHFSVAPLAVISLVIELFFFPHSVVLVPLLEWKVSEFLPALNSCFHCGSTALCSNSLMYSQMWDVCPCLLPLEQHTFCCSKSKWTICAFLKIRGCTYIIAKYLIHNHKYLYSTRCVWIWLFVVFSCTGPAAASGLSAAECCCVCVCVCFFFSSYCSSGRVPTPAALILQWRGLERRALSPAARPHYLSLGAPHPVLRLTPHSTCLIMEPWTSLVFVILWLTGYSRRLLNQRQGGLTLLTQLIFEYCNVPV